MRKIIQIPELPGGILVGHTLLDLAGCRKGILNDKKKVESLMLKVAGKNNAEILHYHFHDFGPGISGVVLGEDAQLAIHTWPEYDSAAVDILVFEKKGSSAVDFLCRELGVSSDSGVDQFGGNISEFAEHALGEHILLDLEGCDEDTLTNSELIGRLMIEAADVAGATRLHHYFCKLGSGVGGMIIIAESHLAIRTWSLFGFAKFEIFTCGKLNCDAAAEYLRNKLRAKKCKSNKFSRLTSKEFRPHKL